jgi:PhnB protein
MGKSKVKAVPDDMRTVTPHLVCAGAAEAIEFYKKAFGAVGGAHLPGPGGKIMHAMIRIGDSAIFLIDEMPEWGALGPKTLKGSSVTIHLQVEDADALYARAIAAGCTVKMEMSDAFWGDRYGKVTDPFGHDWSIASHMRDVTPEEMQEAMKQMGG